VTTEEVVIFLLALASGVSLFIGLAQAFDGRPRRVPLRRAHAAPPSRRRYAAGGRGAEPPRSHGSRIFSPPPGSPEAEASAAAAAAVVASEQMTLIEAPPAEATAIGLAEAPVAPERNAPPEEMPHKRVEALVVVAAVPEPAFAEPVAEAGAEVTAKGTTEAAAEATAEGAEALTDETPAAMVTVPATEDAEAASVAEPAAAVVSAAPPEDLVRECARLLQAGSHSALLAAVEPVLKVRGRGRSRAQASYDRALLWGMAGLASKAGGDEPDARAAFDQGLRAMPKADMAEQDLALFHVAETVGAQLLAGGEAAGDAAASTLAGLRLSVGLLRAVAIAQPGQSGSGNGDAAAGPGADDLPPWGKALRAHLAVERAREALATAGRRRLATFIERGDYVGGHRWLRDATAWDELGDRREAMEDAYWKPLGEEVSRLSGRALESGAEGAGATAALESAEALAAGLPAEARESPRMEEIRRRLWWAQTKVGLQRMEARDVTGALDLFYRALRLAAGDPDREMETRHVLAETLDAQAAGASEHIEGLLQSGARAAAEEAGQQLCRVIDRGLAEGVSQEELAGALSKRQHVMSRIAQADDP
jgi:hypothetical protein